MRNLTYLPATSSQRMLRLQLSGKNQFASQRIISTVLYCESVTSVNLQPIFVPPEQRRKERGSHGVRHGQQRRADTLERRLCLGRASMKYPSTSRRLPSAPSMRINKATCGEVPCRFSQKYNLGLERGSHSARTRSGSRGRVCAPPSSRSLSLGSS